MTAKWIFNVSEVECIRTEKYGDPYDAIATIKVVNGVCHVVRLLSVTKFSREDHRQIEGKVKELGFSEYTMSRNVNGIMVNTVRVIN